MSNMNNLGVGGMTEWQTDAFRTSMVRKLEEAIKESAPHAQRDPVEMENRVYTRSKSREEYLNLIARCILMVKGERRNLQTNQQGGVGGDVVGLNQLQQPGVQGIQQGMNQQGIQQQQSLQQQQGIQQGIPQGMNQQGLQQQQGIQQGIPQGMNQQGLQQQQGIPQGMNQQGLQQQQGIQQGIPQGMNQQGIQQGIPQGMNQQSLQQQGMQQQQQLRMQQQQQQGQMQQQGQLQQQQMMQQQMAMNQQGAMRPGMQQQGSNVSQLQQRLTQQRMPNQMGQQQAQQQQRPQMMGQVGMMPGNRMQMAGQQMNPNMGMLGQVGGPGQIMPGQIMQGQQRGPAPPYMNPSPGGMVQAGGSPMMMSGHGPSPAVPSQFIPSPGSSHSGLPSPGPRSNLAPSPMSVSIATPQNDPPGGEDQAYLDKVKQLGRYIEPLSKMIAKIGDEDQEKLGKMKKLMDILSNPTKRIPMETVLKCEAVLERMNLDASDTQETKYSSTVAPTPPPISSSSSAPLLEAIVKLKSNQKSSIPLNHALQMTFGAPVEALYGSDITLPPLPKRRRRIDLEEASHSGSSGTGVTVPHVLQGEIARLQSHFKVSLDPSQPSGTIVGSILLVCQLEDRDLPSVPPLSVSIPHNYPDTSPSCDTESPEYTSTDFLSKVRSALDSRLTLMPARHTLSQLLNAWEMSVRAACSPRNVPVTAVGMLMGM